MTVSPSKIQSANWSGSIPVHLTLAPTSLSSATMPPTLHKLVPRVSYLHVALRDEIMRLHQFAPTLGQGGAMLIRSAPPDDDDLSCSSRSRARSGSNASAEQLQGNKNVAAKEDSTKSNIKDGGSAGEESDSRADTAPKDDAKALTTSKMPICWFEDEGTGLAMRWHLFAGVLFDLLSQRNKSTAAGTAGGGGVLPWKIRIHFTSYPTNQILSFDVNSGVMQTIQRYYTNALKQALFLQHGSSRVAMNICKADHGKLWDAVSNTNCSLYGEVNAELQVDVALGDTSRASGDGGGNNHGDDGDGGGGGDLQHIPVRVLVDGKPAVQRLCPPFWRAERKDDVDDSDSPSTSSAPTTLGDVLAYFLPSLFERRCDASISDKNVDDTAATTVTDSKVNKKESASSSSVIPTESLTWIIQGIHEIPLTFSVGQIWRTLCHPDHFLYVAVLTR